MEVFRSGLKRGAETLQALNLHTNASALSDFDEQDFGEWEGQSWQRPGQKAAALRPTLQAVVRTAESRLLMSVCASRKPCSGYTPVAGKG